MSVYDATNPHIGGDKTLRAKERIIKIISKELRDRGYKTNIKTEVPAVIDNKKYHADIAVLGRSIQEYDFYMFFIIEIDGDIGHATFRHDKKERIRDDGFLKQFGIITIRIPLDKISGNNKIENDSELFDKYIYHDILNTYLIYPSESIKQQIWSELNRQFSIKLKENSSTKCSRCDHLAHMHSLSGCEFQHTNKSKLKCNCKEPFYTSDD